MARALHVLPHPGGGAETHIDLLERLPGGWQHERVALSTGRTPLEGAASIPRNWPGILRRARAADLVNVHGDMPAMLSLPMLHAAPSLFTTHGLHFTRRSRGARGAAVRRAMAAVLRAADVTVCTSAAERDELAPLGRHARLEVVHNGIDAAPAVDRAAARAELGLAEDQVAALYLGQLEARKDPLLAVRAAAGIPGLVLLVAGDGPQREELAAAGARTLGFRRDPERLLAAADVFVMPSRHEGLSFAVLEAMRAGLACVVSDGPGNPEAVGAAGVVFPAGDGAALRIALQRLAADRGERARLGAAAAERAATDFSVARFLERMGRLYDEVSARGASRPTASRRPGAAP